MVFLLNKWDFYIFILVFFIEIYVVINLKKCVLKKIGIFIYIWRLNVREVVIYVCIYRNLCYVWKDDVIYSVIDSVGVFFYFVVFYCDLRIELVFLYMYLILLYYCLFVFVLVIESLFIVEIDFYMYIKNINNFISYGCCYFMN